MGGGAIQTKLQWDARTLEAIFRGVYDMSQPKGKDFIPILYDVLNSDKDSESFDGVGGEGLMVPWKKSNNQVHYDAVRELWPVSIRNQKYSLGREIDRDLVDDMKVAEIKRKIQSLSNAVHKTQQMQAVEFLANAFTAVGSDYLSSPYNSAGPDGKPLCATDHPYSPTNSTDVQSNKGTSELSIDAWDDTSVAMQEWVDDRGVLMATIPDTLIVAPYNARTAWQIAGIDGKGEGYEPGNANHNINVYEGLITVIVDPYLKNRKAWFAADSAKMKELNKWFWRRKPENGSMTGFDDEIAKFKVVGRWSSGFLAPWFIYGHNPS
ncbi:hypothetical protein J2W97_002273 [Paenibacillus jamilae]|nr:hypothetical protein [Paenibacillus jamilae]